MESISIREAADRLGVSHKVIRRLISQGTLEAHKHPGAHGVEWRVEQESLMAYQTGQAPPRHTPGSRVRLSSAPAPHADYAPPPDTRSPDKTFLQDQIKLLTDLLSQALGSGQHHDAAPAAPTAAGALPCDVTAALQSALQSLMPEGISTIELCSVKVLWGQPVLWRVAVTAPEDVQALLNAVLAPEAVWMPPGEEVVFVWALGADANVIWGAACGPGWFGPRFEDSLRGCRVERR